MLHPRYVHPKDQPQMSLLVNERVNGGSMVTALQGVPHSMQLAGGSKGVFLVRVRPLVSIWWLYGGEPIRGVWWQVA